MKIRLMLYAMLMVMAPALCLAGDVIVIVNKSVSESSLDQKFIKSIYLGKKTSWNDGSNITFVVLNGDVHDTFLKKYVGKKASQFNAFWKKQIFTGKGIPPKKLDSEKAMVEFVAQTPGAIGYVSANAKVANVKTITVK